ncbi:MAG: hypothetical protein ACREBE_23285 [bacterium]
MDKAGESPTERGDHESRDQIAAVIALMNSQRDVRAAEEDRREGGARDHELLRSVEREQQR